jgi:hypothetical protein
VPAPAPVTRHGHHPAPALAIRGHVLLAGMRVCPPNLKEAQAAGRAGRARRTPVGLPTVEPVDLGKPWLLDVLGGVRCNLLCCERR